MVINEYTYYSCLKMIHKIKTALTNREKTNISQIISKQSTQLFTMSNEKSRINEKYFQILAIDTKNMEKKNTHFYFFLIITQAVGGF